MMSAVLSNPGHPKYGVATIPFPIPRDQYTYCMDLLEALEVGDTVKADCKVVEFDSVYTVLKRMKALIPASPASGALKVKARIAAMSRPSAPTAPSASTPMRSSKRHLT